MVDHIVDCEIAIPEESTKIHGITKRRASLKGIPIWEALNDFDNALQECDLVVAHNISFDKRICMVEAIRRKRKQYFTCNGVKKPEFCTMKKTKDLCNLTMINSKGDTYVKFQIIRAHTHLFGYIPKGTHDSMADVLICFSLYDRK